MREKETRQNQVPLFCISITHRQAPAQIRELFSFSEEEQRTFLREALRQGISGAVLVSTCNRTEAYVSAGAELLAKAEELLAKKNQDQLHLLRRYCRIYRGEAAVRHLFRVCAGLDSMVIGEDEILGQTREAYKLTEEENAADFYINTVFQHALECAKQVKTDTCLSKTAVSVATLSASEITHFKEGEKTVLLIGISGQMGGLIAKDLMNQKGIHIYATMRHQCRDCFPENVTMIPYDSRYAYIDRADAVVSATKSPHYTLTYEACREQLGENKKRLFLDIAMPGDVDPDIAELPGVQLRGIDYFQTVAKENNERKQEGVFQAEDIITEHLEETLKSLLFHEFLPKLPAFRTLLADHTGQQLFFMMKEAADGSELSALLSICERLMEENE